MAQSHNGGLFQGWIGQMGTLRTILSVFLIFTALTGWCGAAETKEVNEKDMAGFLQEGIKLLNTRNADGAIPYFDRVIGAYETRYADNTRFFAARNQQETLAYLLKAATDKKNAQVVSPAWAYAYYYKAYALLEKSDIAAAKSFLEQAVALSPYNSQFLSELAYIYQIEKNWPQALTLFQQAETAAQSFSPPDLHNNELARAWRGQAYVYIEQGRLEEAQKLYHQCLELDKNDATALHELGYIEKLRAQRSTR